MNLSSPLTVPFEAKGRLSGGGVLPTLPIRVCAAQGGRDFEAPGLERGIQFRRGS